MLCKPNSCLMVKDVALKWKVICEELIADKWNTVWLSLFIVGIGDVPNLVKFVAQRFFFESKTD